MNILFCETGKRDCVDCGDTTNKANHEVIAIVVPASGLILSTEKLADYSGSLEETKTTPVFTAKLKVFGSGAAFAGGKPACAF